MSPLIIKQVDLNKRPFGRRLVEVAGRGDQSGGRSFQTGEVTIHSVASFQRSTSVNAMISVPGEIAFNQPPLCSVLRSVPDEHSLPGGRQP